MEEKRYKQGDRVIINDPDIKERHGVVHMNVGQHGVSVMLDDGQRKTIARENLRPDEPAEAEKKPKRRGRPAKADAVASPEKKESLQRDEKTSTRERYDAFMNSLSVMDFVRVIVWLRRDLDTVQQAIGAVISQQEGKVDGGDT